MVEVVVTYFEDGTVSIKVPKRSNVEFARDIEFGGSATGTISKSINRALESGSERELFSRIGESHQSNHNYWASQVNNDPFNGRARDQLSESFEMIDRFTKSAALGVGDLGDIVAEGSGVAWAKAAIEEIQQDAKDAGLSDFQSDQYVLRVLQYSQQFDRPLSTDDIPFLYDVLGNPDLSGSGPRIFIPGFDLTAAASGSSALLFPSQFFDGHTGGFVPFLFPVQGPGVPPLVGGPAAYPLSASSSASGSSNGFGGAANATSRSHSGMENITYNDRGGVASYENESRQTVLTNPDHHYSENLLRHYGIEERDDAGQLYGRTTFGGTFRGFADALGFDGEFGIQGNFARDEEGTHDSSGNHNGVRGEGGKDKGSGSKGGGKSKDDRNIVEKAVDSIVKAVKDTFKKVKDFFTGNAPIIFDLDGNGIEITELSSSTFFVDDGDGLLHRTAWAGAGNAVLFYDPDNLGAIVEKRQYVFTEWDPTATSDMEALRSYFDSNGDGVLDASDAEFANFKLLVTNADGSTTAKTMAELGIVSLDLTADATNIELPDGSTITGQTTFTRSDGTTGTAADVMLIAEAQGHRVEQVQSIDANGNRMEVSTGYAADGSIAFVNTSVSAPDGSLITNSYDDNGDGVVDRLQTIETVTTATTVKTVTNWAGGDAVTAVLLNQTVTTKDGNVTTIQRDSVGGGWFDQVEVRTEAADGSMVIVTTDLGQDGSTIRSVTETVSADGLIRVEAIDQDGDGAADLTTRHEIVINADGSRAETITALNADGTTRSGVTETVSTDGQTKTIARDLDGDGDNDTVEHLDITTDATGSTSSLEVRNQDGSLRSKVDHTQSADTLTKTVASDLDGDGDVDRTSEEITVIAADGSRETLTRQLNGDGSLWSQQKVLLGADKVSSEAWVDLDQNGIFETTDLVRSVTVDGVTGERVTTTWDRNENASLNSKTTSVTSADGLTQTTTIDADGDGDTDTQIADTTVIGSNGATTRTVTTRNQDDSLRSETIIETSADGLTTTTTVDTDGDGLLDGKTIATELAHADGSITRQTTTYAGDEITLLSDSVTNQSADRLVTTTSTDVDGDGHVDTIVETVRATDGASTTTLTSYHANGDIAGTSETQVSANGLVSVSTRDADGDGTIEAEVTTATTLNADGSQTTTLVTRNADDTLRSQTETTVSDDGLVTTTKVDADGDNSFERVTTSTTTLNADGSQTTLVEQRAANGDLLSQNRTTTSDDGLVVVQESDADGDNDFDLISTATTVLSANGERTTTTHLREADGTLRSSESVRVHDNGDDTVIFRDLNGDGNNDQREIRDIFTDGKSRTIVHEYDETGTILSKKLWYDFADGLMDIAFSDVDFDNAGYETRVYDIRTLFADGRVRDIEFTRVPDNDIVRRTETITSDDGELVTQTTDLDGDGTVDDTRITTSDIAADGTQTQSTVRTSADGTTLSTSTTTTSADGRIVTSVSDVDGNGVEDMRSTNTLSDAGTRLTTSEYFTEAGRLSGKTTMSTSGDGRTTTHAMDRDGDGITDISSTEVSAIAADGTATRSVEHRGEHNYVVARETYTVSDDGLTTTSSSDFDGDGTFESQTTATTSFAVNGDVIRTTSTRDEGGNLIWETSSTTSGDGLTTIIAMDDGGDGTDNWVSTLTNAADGSSATDIRWFDESGTLQRKQNTTTSADQRTHISSTDLDGDSSLDLRVTTEIDLSRNVTTTTEDLGAGEVATASVVGETSANGRSHSYTFDIDADGTAEFTRSTEMSYAQDGAMITSFTESFGSNVVYAGETRSAANGLSSSEEIDANGDGVVDRTMQTQTTINADGSRDTVTETHDAEGDLRARVAENVSADGRTSFKTYDYDGNGVFEKTVKTELAANGERVEISTTFDETGAQIREFVTTTSADGLLTTIDRGNVTETTTRSQLNNESYTWDNGVTPTQTAAHIVVTHQVDAQGFDTWSWTSTKSNISGTATARVDGVAKQQIFEEAERLYDAALDRGLDTSEREQLVQYINEGQLNKASLADALITSDEFKTRYSKTEEVSDADFIAQVYLNTFGRGPSMVELAAHLTALNDNAQARVDMVVDLADSAEHLVVGNGHMMTNNIDVIMNGAKFERTIDSSYARAVVERLVDVAFDRHATEQELQYLSNLMLNESYTAAQLMDVLLVADPDTHEISADGSTQSVATNNASNSTLVIVSGQSANWNPVTSKPPAGEIVPWSIHFFPGEDGAGGAKPVSGQHSDVAADAIVEQGFLNAFGRAPTAAESHTWTTHLKSWNISTAQFLAALAESSEHLATGNDHVAQNSLGLNTHDGSPASQTLTGDHERDLFHGGAGNDTIRGNSSSDRLHGDEGNDLLYGGSGNDFYTWHQGDGNDIIRDTVRAATESDTLVLLDVTSDGVTLTRSSDGMDLLVTITATGEVITVEDQFENFGYGRGIEVIRFAGGVVWHRDDIFDQSFTVDEYDKRIVTDGDGDNIIYSPDDSRYRLRGDEGDDTLVAIHDAEGLQYMDGRQGNDTYVYYASAGDVRVTGWGEPGGGGIDTFRFADLSVADVTFSTRASGNANDGNWLVMSFEDDGETHEVTIAHEGRRIQRFEFADGASFGSFDITSYVRVHGGDGADVLHSLGNGQSYYLQGNGGNDTLIARHDPPDNGPQHMNGGAGDDTYIYYASAGHMRVNGGSETTSGGTDTFRFADLNVEDVTFSTRASGSSYDGTWLVMSFEYDGETHEVTIAHEGSRIERFEFADGASFSELDVTSYVRVHGDSGADVLHSLGNGQSYYLQGNGGDDTLIARHDPPSGGPQHMNGGAGNDTYIYYASAGHMRVNGGSETTTGGTDTFRFADLNVDDVTFSTRASGNSHDGNWLVITFDDDGETHELTLAHEGNRIERFEFADGEMSGFLDLNQINYASFGNAWGDRTDSDGEVSVGFDVDPTYGGMTLAFRAYDIDDNNEMSVYLNGEFHSVLGAGKNNGYSQHTITFDAQSLHEGRNIVTFREGDASWKWGLDRMVLMDEGSAAAPSTYLSGILEENEPNTFQFGNAWNGLSDGDGKVALGFAADPADGDVSLSLRAYDMDNGTEMSVFLNGAFHSYLGAGSNNGYSNHTLTFDEADLADGMNFITFEEGDASWKWGLDQFDLM